MLRMAKVILNGLKYFQAIQKAEIQIYPRYPDSPKTQKMGCFCPMSPKTWHEAHNDRHVTVPVLSQPSCCWASGVSVFA